MRVIKPRLSRYVFSGLKTRTGRCSRKRIVLRLTAPVVGKVFLMLVSNLKTNPDYNSNSNNKEESQDSEYSEKEFHLEFYKLERMQRNTFKKTTFLER